MNPFPKDQEARRVAHAQMKALAPGVMAQLEGLRALFPKARMTHFKAGDVEFGEASKPGWEVDDNLTRWAGASKARKAKGKK